MQAYYDTVDLVRNMLPKTLVEGAYLEFAKPTIMEGIDLLIDQGARSIAAVPLFLSAYEHTSKDVPEAIEEAARQHPRINITLTPHVGAQQRVVELSAKRYLQSLDGRGEIMPKNTLVALAAHGSTEPGAIDELIEFSARREKLTPVGRMESCFAVMGEPKLADLPERLAPLSSYKRIVVQPHLILQGYYHNMIRSQVDTFHKEYPHIDWIVTEPLCTDPLLAQAVVEVI